MSFDESMNKVTQNEQMDIVITFWNKLDNEINTRYFTSVFLGHTRANDLLEAFQKALSDFDMYNLIQVSMDGPSVNWKFYDDLISNRTETEMPGLLNIGSCGLHVLHGAFKSGANKSEWNIKNILKGLYELFHDSPARRADYLKICGSDKYPKMFCQTRWIEDAEVAERAIEIWDNICAMHKFWENLPKSKRPASKSYLNVHDAITDKMILPKLHFFATVANLMKPFLTLYQTENPMVPFLYDDIHSLIREIMSWFIKPCILQKTKLGSDLCKIDLNDQENLLKHTKINVGCGATKSINNMSKIDDISSSDINNFKKDCVLFLTTFLQKMFERSPLKYSVTRYASSLSPLNMITKPDLCGSRFIHLCYHLNELKNVIKVSRS